jgi:hypothetical protein
MISSSGRTLADELEDFVFRHAAAGEADGPAVALEQLCGDLAAQFLRLVVATEDQDLLAVARTALESAGNLVGDRAVQARRQVQGRAADPVVAVELLEQFHRRPHQRGQQGVRGDARIEGGIDDSPAGGAVAGEERFEIGLRAGGELAHWTFTPVRPLHPHRRPSILTSGGVPATDFTRRMLNWITSDKIGIGKPP